MSPRFREWVIVTGVAVLLTALFTWPLVARFGSAGRVDSGDGRFSIWNVAWVAHALTTSPASVWDANIFHPHPRALSFSEANIFAGVVAIPAWRLTGNPHAASNWTIFCAFVLAAVVSYALTRRLTGSRTGAAVTAVTFAFCPFVFAHLPHIQLLMTFGLPLVLLGVHAFVDRPALGTAAALGGAMALTGLACGYYGVFGGLIAGFGVLWFGVAGGHWRQPRYWLLALAGAGFAAVLIAPFFAPYLEIRDAGFGRSLDDARTYSATWRAYLASARLTDRWMLPFIGQWRDVVFPGFLTVALAIVAIVMTFRSRAAAPPPEAGKVIGFYAALTMLAAWASLGPAGGLYSLLYDTIPLFSLLRAPARLGVIVTLTLAVLAGFGTAAIQRRTSGRTRRAWITAIVAAGLLSSTVGAIPSFEAPPVNPVYQRLAILPRAPVVEFPYWTAAQNRHRHTEYMLMSTYHWQPLVNGYSDHIPEAAFAAAPRLATFPDADAWDVIRDLHVRYVVVHWNLYGGDADQLQRGIAEEPRLRLMLETPRMSLYEVVRWN
jgi:hypothetical protein